MRVRRRGGGGELTEHVDGDMVDVGCVGVDELS